MFINSIQHCNFTILLSDIIWNYEISEKVKPKLYKTQYLTILTYGRESEHYEICNQITSSKVEVSVEY
jgi:hypothetical protein